MRATQTSWNSVDPRKASPFYTIVSRSNDAGAVQDQLHSLDPKSDVRVYTARFMVGPTGDDSPQKKVLRKVPTLISDIEKFM